MQHCKYLNDHAVFLGKEGGGEKKTDYQSDTKQGKIPETDSFFNN